MTTAQERLKASENHSRFVSDLLEQASGGELNTAIEEMLNVISSLRGAVRLQQQQIEAQQRQIDNLLAAVPQAYPLREGD